MSLNASNNFSTSPIHNFIQIDTTGELDQQQEEFNEAIKETKTGSAVVKKEVVFEKTSDLTITCLSKKEADDKKTEHLENNKKVKPKIEKLGVYNLEEASSHFFLEHKHLNKSQYTHSIKSFLHEYNEKGNFRDANGNRIKLTPEQLAELEEHFNVYINNLSAIRELDKHIDDLSEIEKKQKLDQQAAFSAVEIDKQYVTKRDNEKKENPKLMYLEEFRHAGIKELKKLEKSQLQNIYNEEYWKKISAFKKAEQKYFMIERKIKSIDEKQEKNRSDIKAQIENREITDEQLIQKQQFKDQIKLLNGNKN